jgi:hypothetical protein
MGTSEPPPPPKKKQTSASLCLPAPCSETAPALAALAALAALNAQLQPLYAAVAWLNRRWQALVET